MIVFYIICIIVFMLDPSPELYGVSMSNLAGAFTYQFLHGNILHLIINLLSLYLIYKPFKFLYGNRFNYDNDFVLLLISYIGSVAASIISVKHIPTVGASGIVFFILGAILALHPTKQQFINYIWVLVGVIVSAIFGNSNTTLHVVAFLMGVLFIIIRMMYDNCRRENNRGLQTN